VAVCSTPLARPQSSPGRSHLAGLAWQNLNGNTALHYLVEYKHAALVEYVVGKGADDTLPNAAGLTCYEGLSADQVAAL
jgi:ankyrin repeat protein